MKNNLAPAGINIDSCTIEFSNNPIDLLLCGTDMEGSCQNVNGTARLNRGLLGYLLDGKNKLVIVKDQDGKIIARSIARLMWDDKAQETPMLLARLYGIPAMEKAIIRLAKQRSEAMNIPLVSVEVGTPSNAIPQKQYPNEVKGLGGPAPSEYVDEAYGVMEDGVYTARQAHYL